MKIKVIFLVFILFGPYSYALNWTQGAYIDSSWDTGFAELGFGDGDENTVLIPGNNTYYFRKYFYVSDLEYYNSLSIDVKYDDGFVAYINGVEIARANMPEGEPDYNTYALSEHEGIGFETFSIDLQALIDTLRYTESYEMLIAVDVHRVSPSDDDLSFDLQLLADGDILIEISSLWKYYQNGFPELIVTDPVTLVLKPLPNIPVIQKRGEDFLIECDAPMNTDDWQSVIQTEWFDTTVNILSQHYDQWRHRWILEVNIPDATPLELYDLVVTADDVCDTVKNAVKVIDEFKDSYYFVHLTDPHLPEHYSGYNTVPFLEEALNEINIINPEFILLTGDLINRSYEDQCEIAQLVLFNSRVPIFLTIGNHDVGDMKWFFWKYFGWNRLYSEHPQNDGIHTQNYSFDYGECHFTAVECYQNYGGFDWSTYGWCSLIREQVDWLEADLLSSQKPFKCIFYHYDFTWDQIFDIASDNSVDLLLWGHLHYNNVSYYGDILSILTGETYGYNGVYRLIRIDSTEVVSYPLLEHQRHDITLHFDCSNDGTQHEITATIVNEYNETFENGLIKFFVPVSVNGYEVSGGDIIQVVETPEFLIYYINVIIPQGTSIITISEIEGISESFSQKAISLYPNPSCGIVNLRYTGYKDISIKLYDLCGMVMNRVKVSNRGEGEVILKLGNLPKGIYFLSIESPSYRRIEKIVLIR
ncbi:metallophosphoesterase [candidate division WOR-3 bacterium]|nr:metallophosphoesterase [candidate division WOR-3 bacterium]